MKNKIIFLLLAFLAFVNVNAQILDPVKWTTKIEKKSDNTYLLTFDGVIEKDWHLYSQFTPDGGPLPLEVIFKNQKDNFALAGKAKESKTKTAYNDIFEVNETFFEGKAQIRQEIKLTNPKVTKIEAELNYQVCKEVCINLEKKFTFSIPQNAIVAANPKEEMVVGTIADTTKVDSLAPSLGASEYVEAEPIKGEVVEMKPDSKKENYTLRSESRLSQEEEDK